MSERPAGDPPGLTDRQRITVGVVIGVFFAAGMIYNGHVAPGLVGGALGALLCFLVLRDYDRQRAERRRGG